MKARGTIKGFTRDYESGKYQMVLELDSRAVVAYDTLKGKDIDVSMYVHKDKRNLDQNALYWSVVGEIATYTKQSTAVIHNLMLRRYGFPMIYEGQIVYAMIPDGADDKVLQDEATHLKPTSQTKVFRDGTVRRTYMLMRGSHDLNKAEFSFLLDGAISEAKEMGVTLHEPS